MTLLNKIKESTLFYPAKLTLSLTTICNLSCEHCWVECDSQNLNGVVAPKQGVLQSIKDFIKIGGKEICLTGGEPLTHPDFLEILKFCINSKLETVLLQTNATLLNANYLKTFRSIDKKKLFFQISLDGATASTNDFVRGEGSFIRATQGISELVTYGFGKQVSIGFTEMQHNMHEIPDMLKYAKNVGIKSVVGWSLVNFGKASQSDRLGPPSPHQYEHLLELYHQDREFRLLYDQYGTFSAIEWYKGLAHPEGHSCRFIEKLYLSATGKLYPCTLLQDDQYAAFDIFNSSLIDAINDKFKDWTELKKLSQRRSRELSCQNSCSGGKHCAGGCFARMHKNDEGMFTSEDRCQLRRAVYDWASRHQH